MWRDLAKAVHARIAAVQSRIAAVQSRIAALFRSSAPPAPPHTTPPAPQAPSPPAPSPLAQEHPAPPLFDGWESLAGEDAPAQGAPSQHPGDLDWDFDAKGFLQVIDTGIKPGVYRYEVHLIKEGKIIVGEMRNVRSPDDLLRMVRAKHDIPYDVEIELFYYPVY